MQRVFRQSAFRLLRVLRLRAADALQSLTMCRVGEQGFVEVAGGRIYYETDGDGHPLVLVHAGVANLRQWDEQVPVFAERYRVIRYDTRGYGRTESEEVAFSNRADLAAVLDHVGADSTFVLGASRGGMIALDFAIERPQRVDALIVAAGGVGGYSMEESPDEEAVWEKAERLTEAKDWEALADFETRFWVDGPGQPTDRVDPELRTRVHDWILSSYRAEKPDGQPQPLEPPAAERLDEVRMPVLVMIGDLDERTTQVACGHLAVSVPNGRLETFPGVAHMINLEQPDRFNHAVMEFLAESPAVRR
jgi:3-oxoadipate enol-lactonase